ncbi:UDP-glucose 4-epimerase [Halovivax ruber XH-70]|uniref:UDP-glucose 4-epimerase n=1 Tax=Halovivax ruber (strain DSM 18193 / JCM 13892 / XH-70) TaxID=797302 RepID=L0IA74_HALRX|nr:NAD-dependent epimerase/dehydratase family protein [Halovivax ruber]AGB15634.1 UDP-glucose 4-epimerase [Halovivax ruber XH-70]
MTETILVTGGAGLIGSMCCEELIENGYNVVSVDNYGRGDIFGDEGNTESNVTEYLDDDRIDHHQMDIRDDDFDEIVASVDGIIHTAAQPSHPRSIEIPYEDFDINVRGTLKLLEAVRTQNPDIPLVFTSTNKVYGEMPNYFSYEKVGDRFEPVDDTLWNGFDESLRIDQNKHTPFGVSKASADLYVQEYARMYDIKAGIFRLGCVTGGAAHAVELHNWEPYFVKLALTGEELSIYGYEGYQVRDVIHAKDLANLFRRYLESPSPGQVYNVGGGRKNSISLRESFDLIEEVTGNTLEYSHAEQREADHQWWISDLSKVHRHYPDWEITHGLREIFEDITKALRKNLDEVS